jgi:hypothetical protein
MSATLSPLDRALLAAGFDESALAQHPGYERPDDPPDDAILITEHLIGPPKDQTSPEQDFPFSTENQIAVTEAELVRWQEDRARQLIDLYQEQLDQLPDVADANVSALASASPFDQRRQFYYCHLMSILDAPKKTAFEHLNRLICLKKLWQNRRFLEEKQDLETCETCCIIPGCPQIAIHGSQFCGWHILRDERQRLFVPCPVCGWPKLNSEAFPCNAHRAERSRTARKSRGADAPP